MSLTITLQTAVLDRYFGSGAVVRIGTGPSCWCGICTADPGETGTTTNEVDFGGRKQILSTNWEVPANGETSNDAFLPVYVATGAATLTDFLLGDTSTVNSTHDYTENLVTPVTTVATDQVRFGDNTIVVNVVGLFSHYQANDLLNELLRNQTIAPAANYYYALSTTAPNPDGTNVTEPSGGAYARVTKTRGGPFAAAGAGSPSAIANANEEILWPLATASWGTISHWAIYDAATSGNMLFYGALDSSKSVVGGTQPGFALGDFIATME